MSEQKSFFKQAVPVWLRGKESEMNICAELVLQAEHMQKPVMYLTGATFYQVLVDGELVHYGPERKATGYAAIDEVKLPENLNGNQVVIRAMGYNCRCFNGCTGVSFIQAEVFDDDRLIAATGKNGFKYYRAQSRLQKVIRYSSQRHFSECWDFNRNREESEISVIDPGVKYYLRSTPLSELQVLNANLVKSDNFVEVEDLKMPIFAYLKEPPKNFDHFSYDEVETKPLENYLKTRIDKDGSKKLEMWNFDNIQTGFFRLEVEAESDASLMIAFAEQLGDDNRPNLKAVDSCNIIKVTVPKGNHIFYSMEPYTVMYAEVLYTDGDAKVKTLSVKELAFPQKPIIPYKSGDEELDLIYDAAVRTFRHNTLDIFMDCPSRERAGWLFDSYYTAKAEYSLTGDSVVEKAFLHNFLDGGLRKSMKGVTEMCYPSNVYSGNIVPQWSMWFVLQAAEYMTKRGHMDEKPLFKEAFFNLTEFFKDYENEYGLLEKLPGWNFVEWSALNHRVWDVSWPSNMLYAKMLETIGNLYDTPELVEKAEKLRDTIRNMAFDGKLFMDRAMRTDDGKLENTEERSETAQYYAMFFDVIDDDKKYDLIRNILIGEADIENIDGYKDIEPSDAMPGLYLKLDLLLDMERYDLVIKNIREYFGPMARTTGTLWERKSGITSRDHGFASFVAPAIKIACGR
ncbi:MAG: hypothetical protein IKW62_03360 [Clostridia bacterium]|nr:hypothetical protein [Clostridia bacterium]